MTHDDRPDEPRPNGGADDATSPGAGQPPATGQDRSDWPFGGGPDPAEDPAAPAVPPEQQPPAAPSPWAPSWHQSDPGWGAPGAPPPPPYGYRPYGSADAPEPRRRRIGAATVVALVLVALVGGGVGAAVENQLGGGTKTVVSSLAAPAVSNNAADKAPSGSVQQVAAGVLPSVVSITVATGSGGDEGLRHHPRPRRPHPHQQPRRAAAAAGRARPADSDLHRRHDRTRRRSSARDPTTDLAVIKVKRRRRTCTPAALGNSGEPRGRPAGRRHRLAARPVRHGHLGHRQRPQPAGATTAAPSRPAVRPRQPRLGDHRRDPDRRRDQPRQLRRRPRRPRAARSSASTPRSPA